jgi:DNA-binding transcriptional regulator PaaX
MTKYKYYFKKPKLEITKDILNWLAMAGAIYIAASSPYFIFNILKEFKKGRKYKKKYVYNAFYRLKREGYIIIEKKNHQIYIRLTKEGRKRAGRFQIDALKITKPKKWDGKWRLIIFDISQLQKTKREAFRGKLKELGFYPLQKSVWVHPYPCSDEIHLLRDFLGLDNKEIRVVIAEKIENSNFLKKIFKLN